MRKINRIIKKKNRSAQAGFSALIVITTVSAVILGAAISAGLLGIQELKNTLTYQKGQELELLAFSCAEEALWQLKNDHNYSGHTFILNNHQCHLSVEDNGDQKNITLNVVLNENPEYLLQQILIVEARGKSINLIKYK